MQAGIAEMAPGAAPALLPRRVLVAMETDATRYYGTSASRPALLGSRDAEQMLAHLAADLQALLPEISQCQLIAAGALYDQTQVLRPGYPVFRALEAAVQGGESDRFSPGLISIGSSGASMPIADLQPFPEVPLGMLQLLPIIIRGRAGQMHAMAEAMEYRFLEEGQLSAHSAAWLETAFGVAISHARLMTMADLHAMLQMQLEHFGFLTMWELLDAALADRAEPLKVTTAGGHGWEWRSGAAHTEFESFDHWARAGAGANLPAARLALAAAYAAWTRELRQYLTTLSAHGLTVHLHLPGREEPLQGTYFSEVSDAAAGDGDSVVTEHSFDDLGPVAVTVVNDARIENCYPLGPLGLNDIQARLRECIPSGHTVAFPGTILYDEDTRRLRPDTNLGPGIN